MAPDRDAHTGDTRCAASMSGHCLEWYESGKPCPPGECDRTPAHTGDTEATPDRHQADLLRRAAVMFDRWDKGRAGWSAHDASFARETLNEFAAELRRLIATVEQVTAERDAADAVIRRFRDGWIDLPFMGSTEIRWCKQATEGDNQPLRRYVPITPAEAEALARARTRTQERT